MADRFIVASDSGSASDSATVRVVPYAETLLQSAQGLIDRGEPAIATVVAHMACEIAVERALSRAYAARGLQYLEDAVDELLNGYNLANPRIRQLFNALTGRSVQGQPFWPQFTASATRRNRAVHGGRIPTPAEAEESLQAATALVEYLR